MKLRVLHVEDSENDSEIVHEILMREGVECRLDHRETRDEFVARLKARDFDLILADGTLPGFLGLHALELARKYVPEIPFMFVSGTLGKDTEVELLRSGATDYVCKDRLSRRKPAPLRLVEDKGCRAQKSEMKKRQQQAKNLETVGTLAGGIAHDFNNILTIIKGHASLLERECGNPARIREISAIIDHATRRGSDLVKEMLAFARKSDGIFSRADFNQVVSEAVQMLRESIPPNISLEFALDEALPDFMVDTGQVERVILNLVGNARDAMPDGGRIIISTGRITDTATIPCLSSLPRREYAYLQVSDTGTGMDEATRRRIFEPFFTTKAKGKGTGLGMPVVYGVIQMHHGAIDVLSTVGKGTSVELYFPLVLEADRRGPATAPAAPRPVGGSETLLVVDDEPEVLSFLGSMLESHGYHILTAGSAEEAFPLFHRHRAQIALLFSDLGLPGLDGYDLGERLRQLKPGLKCVLGSGYADSEIKDRVHESIDTGFLSKPYTPASVLATIRAALDEETPTIQMLAKLTPVQIRG